MSCIFCDIVNKNGRAHIIWEDEKHLAFLSIYPNTEGFTVVIPKDHYTSYIFDQSDDVINSLMKATKTVAKLLDMKLADVGRTGLIFEGFGVDHLHSKLVPMHGTSNLLEWEKISSSVDKFFHHYEGYISSHDYIRCDDDTLLTVAEKLRK